MVSFTDEKHLLIDLKGGSFQAFERLYNMYSGKLYNFIMRLSSGNQYMAEEVVQSTFIRIWEVREKVDTNASFISFLCTIAKNLLMNMYQRQTVEYVYNEYLLKSSVDRDSQTEEKQSTRDKFRAYGRKLFFEKLCPGRRNAETMPCPMAGRT